ncbi:GNAT family N-acetyltransferase [Pseudomonas fulva]|nr:GNAT family N-acetyltransferase [Pseudomonas fulva]MBF8778322.1 GNAT family N-acetyltransferase [Pseudomonas fulva]
MPEATAAPVRICLLDKGYRRETRMLLYQAYRQEPTMAHLLERQRPGFERRLRVLVRERVRQHFYLQLPAIGLLVEDRLVGAALIVPPQRRLEVTDSWVWRLRMVLGVGTRCTRRYLDYELALAGCLATPQVHRLPLLGVDPLYQGQHHGERLLQAVHDWCAEDEGSSGVVLGTANPNYLAFCEHQGYEEIGEIVMGPIRERVFFHAAPGPAAMTPGATGFP